MIAIAQTVRSEQMVPGTVQRAGKTTLLIRENEKTRKKGRKKQKERKNQGNEDGSTLYNVHSHYETVKN